MIWKPSERRVGSRLFATAFTWTRGLFLFVSMTLFGFFAGDHHLLRTIAALRDEDVFKNPRTRSKGGFFVKAPVWKPDSFFPLPSALITQMLAIVDAVPKWDDLGDGQWCIDVDDSTPAGVELGLLLADYWKTFREKIRAATFSRCGATLALSSQSLPSYIVVQHYPHFPTGKAKRSQCCQQSQSTSVSYCTTRKATWHHTPTNTMSLVRCRVCFESEKKTHRRAYTPAVV